MDATQLVAIVAKKQMRNGQVKELNTADTLNTKIQIEKSIVAFMMKEKKAKNQFDT